jgi:hypothetical protein
MEALIRVHEVDERSSRDVIRRTGIKLLTKSDVVVIWADTDVTEDIIWELRTGNRDRATLIARLSALAADLPESVTHVRWGRVATPDWVAIQKEQVETCYRPGTSNTPMDGVIRQAELSHKQYFEGSTFQNPINRKA